MESATSDELWDWLAQNHGSHPGIWVQVQKSSSQRAPVTFHELLETGIACGWSARKNLDRQLNYILAAYMASGT